MKKSTKSSLSLIVILSLMSALSMVLKCLAFNIGLGLRCSFENLPIIFSGIAFGPLAGAAVGVVADLVGCLLLGYEINLIVTVGAAVIGLSSGLVSLLISGALHRISSHLWLVVLIAESASHLLGSVIIKTVGLSAYYAMPFEMLLLLRLLIYLIIGVIEGVLIYVILKNPAISSEIRKIKNVGRARGRVNMSYEEAIEYIHSVSWTFCKPGLSRIGELCEALGHPEDGLKFIHVAGTNGKGSFCSMTSSILEESGYKVGLFTSPYITRFNERMRINGEDISDLELAEIVGRVKPICDKMNDKPTEFELITAIAFVYFSSHKCDYVVLECGLGGRLDSTNIIKAPILSVITGIALDHTAILGDTPEKIAYEKAGIIKAGVPVLFGGEGDSVIQVIRERAEAVGSRLHLASDDEPTKVRCGLFGADFDVEWISGLHISLLGKYQVKNARNVLFAVRLMREIGLDIPDAAVRRGLEKAVWKARFEVLSREPLVIYDGAHNREGVDALYESVKEYFGDSPLICLSGTLADKEYGHTAEILSRIASRVYTITPENPRALSAEDFAKCIESLGTEAHSSESIPEAVARAYSDAKESGYPLVCFGSLYTYADVAEQIRKQKEA